jgi:hypothetical protein
MDLSSEEIRASFPKLQYERSVLAKAKVPSSCPDMQWYNTLPRFQTVDGQFANLARSISPNKKGHFFMYIPENTKGISGLTWKIAE